MNEIGDAVAVYKAGVPSETSAHDSTKETARSTMYVRFWGSEGRGETLQGKGAAAFSKTASRFSQAEKRLPERIAEAMRRTLSDYERSTSSLAFRFGGRARIPLVAA